MSPDILITAEAFGGTRDSHAKWLEYLLRTPLRDALPESGVVSAAFSSEAVSGAGLVIGFELSEASRRSMNEKEKVWIDLRIAPLRFLDDIYFTFETNHPGIREKLEERRIDATLCRYHADLVRATVLKLKKADIVEPGTLLLIGQTEADRVVFDGTKHLTLADRITELEALNAGYDRVLFKPHPYAKNGRAVLRELRRGLGNVEATRANIYHLLANEGVRHVAALNSSVLHEAECFGKAVTFLFTPTFTEEQVGIYGDYFSGAFWSDILAPAFETRPSDLQLPFVPGRLRKTLNDFWGYNAIDAGIVLEDIAKEKVKKLLGIFR